MFSQGSLTYNIAAIPSSTFANQPPFLGPSYSSDHITFCYGTPYATPTYLPNLNSDSKTDGNNNPDNENLGNTGSQNDENNDSGIKSESSSTEQKQTPPSINENETNPSDEKRRDSNSVRDFLGRKKSHFYSIFLTESTNSMENR